MKIIFFGLGSIGKRHLNILQSEYDHDIYAFRSGANHNPILGKKELGSWDEIDTIKPDVAFICNPSHLHIETALKCAQRDMDLFIEKPIDVSCDRLDELLEIVEEKGLKSYVAYPFRHHSALQLIEKNQPGPNLVYCSTDISSWGSRSEYSKKKATGGGAILELSHEFDLAEWLSGPIDRIEGSKARNANVTEDAEDLFSGMLHHESGNRTFIFLNIAGGETPFFRDGRYFRTGNHTYCYHATDEMYSNQLKYFFETENPDNNLAKAAPLFRKMIELRG